MISFKHRLALFKDSIELINPKVKHSVLSWLLSYHQHNAPCSTLESNPFEEGDTYHREYLSKCTDHNVLKNIVHEHYNFVCSYGKIFVVNSADNFITILEHKHKVFEIDDSESSSYKSFLSIIKKLLKESSPDTYFFFNIKNDLSNSASIGNDLEQLLYDYHGMLKRLVKDKLTRKHFVLFTTYKDSKIEFLLSRNSVGCKFMYQYINHGGLALDFRQNKLKILAFLSIKDVLNQVGIDLNRLEVESKLSHTIHSIVELINSREFKALEILISQKNCSPIIASLWPAFMGCLKGLQHKKFDRFFLESGIKQQKIISLNLMFEAIKAINFVQKDAIASLSIFQGLFSEIQLWLCASPYTKANLPDLMRRVIAITPKRTMHLSFDTSTSGMGAFRDAFFEFLSHREKKSSPRTVALGKAIYYENIRFIKTQKVGNVFFQVKNKHEILSLAEKEDLKASIEFVYMDMTPSTSEGVRHHEDNNLKLLTLLHDKKLMDEKAHLLIDNTMEPIDSKKLQEYYDAIYKLSSQYTICFCASGRKTFFYGLDMNSFALRIIAEPKSKRRTERKMDVQHLSYQFFCHNLQHSASNFLGYQHSVVETAHKIYSGIDKTLFAKPLNFFGGHHNREKLRFSQQTSKGFLCLELHNAHLLGSQNLALAFATFNIPIMNRDSYGFPVPSFTTVETILRISCGLLEDKAIERLIKLLHHIISIKHPDYLLPGFQKDPKILWKKSVSSTLAKSINTSHLQLVERSLQLVFNSKKFESLTQLIFQMSNHFLFNYLFSKTITLDEITSSVFINHFIKSVFNIEKFHALWDLINQSVQLGIKFFIYSIEAPKLLGGCIKSNDVAMFADIIGICGIKILSDFLKPEQTYFQLMLELESIEMLNLAIEKGLEFNEEDYKFCLQYAVDNHKDKLLVMMAERAPAYVTLEVSEYLRIYHDVLKLSLS